MDETNRDILRAGSRTGQKVVAFAFNGLVKTITDLNQKVTNAISTYNNNLSINNLLIADVGKRDSLADLSNDSNGKLALDVKGKIVGFDLSSQKYSVDYAAFYNQKADKTYLLFRGEDMESINKAFQSYVDNLNSRNKISIYKRITEIEAAQAAAPALAAAKGIGKAAEAGAKVAKQAINHTEHTR